MKNQQCLKALSLACLIAVAGCAHNSGVVSMGGDTYMITRQAATGFSGSGNLKAKAIREASAYCASRGRIMKIVAITEAKPPYVLANFPKAEVVFKALDPSSPELKEPSEFDSAGTQIKVGGAAARKDEVKENITAEKRLDRYAELERLDDLKKKGVITEEEFQAEKKKLLSREAN